MMYIIVQASLNYLVGQILLLFSYSRQTGLTPLMEAASGGYHEVGKVLIAKVSERFLDSETLTRNCVQKAGLC